MKLPMYSLFKYIFDKAYTKADQLIVLGRDMANVLEQKVGKWENPKVTIIENWADIGNIKPQPFPEGKIILEYAGNIGRVQGLDKVMDMLPEDVELHFYGTGAMEKKLKERKRKNVFFHIQTGPGRHSPPRLLRQLLLSTYNASSSSIF